MWSEAAGLLCFPESQLRSWHLAGRRWQGLQKQWNNKVNHSYYLRLSGKCRPFGFVFLGFYLQNFLSPREIELESKPCKENEHFFPPLFFGVRQIDGIGRLYEVHGKQRSCSMRSSRTEKLYRERAVLEKPPKQGLQLVFAVRHETNVSKTRLP